MSVWEWPKEFRGTVESSFHLMPSSLSSASPYTGEETVYGPQFQRFQAKLTFPAYPGPARNETVNWRILNGFITRLRGRSQFVRLVDYHRMRCQYDVAVSPSSVNWSDGSTWSDGAGWENGFLPPFVTVDEAAVRGDDSVVLRSFPASLVDVLRPGDLMEFLPNGERRDYSLLHEVTHYCRSNADGKTRVTFQAPLRIGLAPGDAVSLRYPSGVFRLASDGEGVMQRSLGNIGQAGLSFNERLP